MDNGKRWLVRVRVRHYLGQWGKAPFTDRLEERPCWSHDGMKAASGMQALVRGENPGAEVCVWEFYETTEAGERTPPTAAELAERQMVTRAYGGT